MRNVIHPRLRPASDDRGAVGVLVGVLIAAGVLFGMTAVVVDVGVVYAERAQLQNGADAGALAVAKSCVIETCDPAEADAYANENAKDASSAVDLVCGLDESATLPVCPPSTGARVDCPPLPSGLNYVDVHTSTLTEDGSTLLPPSFAQTLAGNDSPEGVTVGACARAMWAPPGPDRIVIPVTISTCEWVDATTYGVDYAPSPPYPPNPDPDYSRVLRLHDPKQDSSTSGNEGATCTDEKAVDGPGMFGWVDDPEKDCSAEIEGDTYGSDPGADAKNCKTVLQEARENQTPVFIPLYSEVNGTGTNGEYTWDGYAAFIVTGYHGLPGIPNEPDWLNPANTCGPGGKCIFGFFIEDELMPGGGSTGGPDRGVAVIKLTG